MSRDRPTLDELRAGAQKQRHREIGNVLARRFGRPAAIYGTWVAVRLGISAHQVTLFALAAAIASAIAIGQGSRSGLALGVALAWFAFWLDHVDGQVARWTGRAGLDGVFFDYLLHHLSNAALGFALGQGLALRDGDPNWSVAGFAIAVGWTGLNLSNDCRYKAFFQRLKSGDGRYIVECGAGGRPAPPPPAPRDPVRAAIRLSQKACEPHVVLLGLSAITATATISESLGYALLRGCVGCFAVVAPLLAIARCGRLVATGGVEREFAIWFRPEVELDGRRERLDSERRAG
ncbi:MAG: CDP-alcohol phosphatidyltransferase family protein [Isosphaeraceae bacterium]|nr:CDP-alcohol phosphatidyltransferase family protein [Isosphaeraceae bacterium]